jgi:hypothetical protein
MALAMVLTVQARAEIVETRALDERIAVDNPAGVEIVVDNVFGSVRVTGHDEPVVELGAIETVRGATQSDVTRARDELNLQTVQEPGRIAFLVRRNSGCDCDCCRWNLNGYVVEYEIELRVPREAAIDISTVTGELTAFFERQPDADTSFKTVNGEINVTYPSDLSAELCFKTMRGEIWTDFDVAALPAVPAEDSRQGRGTAIRWDRHAAVRAGSGGPTHTFETLNGDIYVRAAR